MKIAIDMGHTISGADYGSVGFIKESEETRNIGEHVIALLRAKGHTAVDITVDKATSVDASLYARTSKVPSDCDMAVSIHLNAAGGRGAEIYTPKATQYPEAQRVLKNLEELGLKNPNGVSRGIKDGSGLALCNTRAKKDMLIEVCFVDSADADIYKKIGAEKVARAIVAGLLGEKSRGDEIDMTKEDLNKMLDYRDAKLLHEIKKLISPSATNSEGNSDSHWAYGDVVALNAKDMKISELRLNDLMTRGEVFSLIRRAGECVK